MQSVMTLIRRRIYNAASDLGLHCLPMSFLWDDKLKWVNTTASTVQLLVEFGLSLHANGKHTIILWKIEKLFLNYPLLLSDLTLCMINPQWLKLPRSRTNFHGPIKGCTSYIKVQLYLTLILLNLELPCLCKQCRSRSVGFWRSQLIWICIVCH